MEHRARRKAIELHANRAGIETVREIGSGIGYTVVEAVASYLKDMEPPQREPKTTPLTNTVWNSSPGIVQSASSAM